MATGAQIRAGRALLGWTQQELAKRAQISERTLRMVEGESSPYERTIAMLQEPLEAAGIVFLTTPAGIGVLLTSQSLSSPTTFETKP